MTKVKLTGKQISFLYSIMKSSIDAWRNWVDEGLSDIEHYVRADLNLRLQEIGKANGFKHGLNLYDDWWLLDWVEENGKRVQNQTIELHKHGMIAAIELPYDEENSEYSEERGEKASWILEFYHKESAYPDHHIKFQIFDREDSRCEDVDLGDNEFALSAYGKNAENEKAEKACVRCVKEFFKLFEK